MQLDKEDLMSYEQRRFFEKNDSNRLTPFNIFFAVLGAILASWLIRQVYLEWQVQQALATFNQQMQLMSAQSQAQLKSIQLQNEARLAEANERVRIQAEEKERQKLAKVQLDNENRARIEAEANERIRKAEAWESFYTPVKGCEADNSNRDPMKCGNDYIRARERFEASYQVN